MTEQNEQTGGEKQPVGNPSFSFSKMTEDAKAALLNPKEHFSTMSLTGGYGEPVIKALIYGVIAGIFSLLWSLFHISPVTGTMLGSTIGFMALIWSVIGAMIVLFVGGAILLVLSSIGNGSTDYEANVRVTADLMVLMPVQAILGIFGFIPVLGTLIGLAVNLYGLWMMYLALKGVLKARENTARIISLVLAGVVVLFLLIGMATRKAVRHLNRHSTEILEQYSKAAEEMARKAGGDDAAKAVKEAIREGQQGSTIVYVLEKADGSKIKNPETSDIKEAINAMTNDDDFVILNRGDNEFLQVAKSGNGYLLQYKDEEGLFEAKDTHIAPELVIYSFTTYLTAHPGWIVWKNGIEWQEAEH